MNVVRPDKIIVAPHKRLSFSTHMASLCKFQRHSPSLAKASALSEHAVALWLMLAGAPVWYTALLNHYLFVVMGCA